MAAVDAQDVASDLDPATLRALRVALVLAVGADDPPAGAASGRATLRLRFSAGRLLGVAIDPGSGDARLDHWLTARFERSALSIVLPASLARGRFEIALPVEWQDS